MTYLENFVQMMLKIIAGFQISGEIKMFLSTDGSLNLKAQCSNLSWPFLSVILENVFARLTSNDLATNVEVMVEPDIAAANADDVVIILSVPVG